MFACGQCSGFTKTFGYLGIAAAFIFTARRENRARTAAAMIPLAVTASVASITEPIDFLFCFVSPLLWVAHAVITGGFMVLLHVLHVRAFTSNLLGSLVFNLSAGEQLQNLPLLYLLGLAEILTYFAVFSILIKAKDLPTPGREAAPSTDQSPYADPQEVCRFIAALGGPENIAQLGNCFTRLRLNGCRADFQNRNIRVCCMDGIMDGTQFAQMGSFRGTVYFLFQFG